MLDCSLAPRRITTDTMIGPIIRPNILDDRTFPEICCRYLVEDKVVFPLVRILQTQRSRLVIPVQRTKLLIHEALRHTMDVIAADEPVVVKDTSGLPYIFHTSALVHVRDVEQITKHTGLWVASHERRHWRHTSTVFSGMILFPGRMHRILVERHAVLILGDSRRHVRRLCDL